MLQRPRKLRPRQLRLASYSHAHAQASNRDVPLRYGGRGVILYVVFQPKPQPSCATKRRVQSDAIPAGESLTTAGESLTTVLTQAVTAAPSPSEAAQAVVAPAQAVATVPAQAAETVASPQTGVPKTLTIFMATPIFGGDEPPAGLEKKDIDKAMEEGRRGRGCEGRIRGEQSLGWDSGEGQNQVIDRGFGA